MHAASELSRLLAVADPDGDARITRRDVPLSGETGRHHFFLADVDGQSFEVSGTYYLANLLQELSLAVSRGEAVTNISIERVFESALGRLERRVRDEFWQGLERCLDEESIEGLLSDSKVTVEGLPKLYVPETDPAALVFYQDMAARRGSFAVEVLDPTRVGPHKLARLSAEGRHGLLALAGRPASGLLAQGGRSDGYRPLPYLVPGGRFNEMYGWDSYFIGRGLLADGRIAQAQALCEHLAYEVMHYGSVLNGNRTYYLLRSQPPLLPALARSVLAVLPDDAATQAFAGRMMQAAQLEYARIWAQPPRFRADLGLTGYGGQSAGLPPEVEPGHFDTTLAPYAQASGLSLAEFKRSLVGGAALPAGLDEFFRHDVAVRESGHDTTYRWHRGGREAAGDFLSVDLNALLFRYETDLARLIESYPRAAPRGGSGRWWSRAHTRREAIVRQLWCEEQSLFFDMHAPTRTRSDFVSAAVFYVLWASDPTDSRTALIGERAADRLAMRALERLEAPGGVLGSDAQSLALRRPVGGHERQWDYPHGWAPHQLFAWEGLSAHGRHSDASRLAYRWIYTILTNAIDFNGALPEKFDVLRRCLEVDAEYGNVGTDFTHVTREGFGWTNASFKLGLARLSAEERDGLQRMIPPEWRFL